MIYMGRTITLLFIFLFVNSFLIAQKTTCPCHDCPGQIVDGVDGFEGIPTGEYESTQDFHVNIFNVLNNDLSSNSQCVKSVQVKFTHDYVGDVNMYLFSPDGDSVQLIGPLNGGDFFSTSNTIFDVGFVRLKDNPRPEDNLEKRWSNEQDWAVLGSRKGTYFPHNGNLEDFNQGRVNGTWTLRVHDSEPAGNDVGRLIDFSVEFCDPTGLVCDPCEEEKALGIPCVFQLEGTKEQITPKEGVCVDVLSQNVAFVKTMQWSMAWDPTVVKDAFIQNTNNNVPEFTSSNFTIDNTNGTIQLNYQLPPTDTLGAVIADSSLLFQVCFAPAGEEGDSTLIDFSSLQVTDIEDMALPTDSEEGSVLLTVDLTADCATATQLCGKEKITVESTKGPGFIKDEGGDCWNETAETQSKWYQFDVLQTGTFEFMVQPLAAAGFRYILLKDGCDGEAVICYPGGNNDENPIGISDDGQASFGVPGKFGESIDVKEGESYFLVIDNKDNNSVGFNLEFGGTARIGDNTLTAVIAPPPILDCNQDTILLNTAGTSTGEKYAYEWEIEGGNFKEESDVLAPVLDKAGRYTLQVTDTDSKCTISASVEVTDDFNFPIADAGETFTLSCTDPNFELDGSDSSMGDEFHYDWAFLSGGNIIQKVEPTNALTDRPGTYILAVTNTSNNCISRDTVEVLESMDRPDLAVDSTSINCTQSTVTVEAVSNTDGVIIKWEGEDITTLVEGTNYTTSTPGIYTLTATAPNGCTKTVDLTIADDREFPTALAGEDFTLTCRNPTFQMQADSSSKGADFAYEWRTTDGHFVEEGELNDLTPQVDSAGLYILKITNTSNGCIQEDSVLLSKDFVLPTIDIKSNTLLTCFEETIIIDASDSDAGAIYDFNWIVKEEGNIVSGDLTYEPVINKGGLYILALSNIETGCTNRDSVSIDVSQDRPNIRVQDQSISCTFPVVELQAESDTAGVIWSWAGQAVATNTEGATLQVDLPGEYVLTALAPNGCTQIDTVSVADDQMSPNLTVSNDSILTCSIDGIDLTAASTTENTTFQWRSPNGDSSSTAQILATVAGEYIQMATAPNGCITMDSVTIDNDENAPVAIIEMPTPLSCDSAYIAIDARGGSSQGDQFDYTWTTTDGLFDNGAVLDGLTTAVTEPGNYQLTIYDRSNDCETTTNVEVVDIRREPTILLNKPLSDTLTCLEPTLSYSVNTNANIPDIRWNLENELLSNTDSFTIDKPGNYRIIILDESNNCSSTKRIEIAIDTIAPTVEAGTTKELNCAVGEVIIDGSASIQGANYSYNWTNASNASISTNLETIVSQEGLYRLTVINTRTGCINQDTVSVKAALDNPIAAAGNDTIFCKGIEDFELLIGTDATSQGNNFSYKWYDNQETEVGNELMQAIFTEGEYILKVTNTANNCVASDTILVTERPRPNITVEESGSINCRDNLITYIARSDLPNTTISWDGQEVFQDTILRATDALAGASYVAYGIENTTGCENQSRFITITPDRNLPIVNPGVNAVLNCQDTLLLDGSFSQKGDQYRYTWSTEDGNILGTADSITAMADAPGTYLLTIFNTQNFCSNNDTVAITDNRIAPAIELDSTAFITCTKETIELGSDTFPTGPTLFYTWSDLDGNELGTSPTLPNISSAGEFTLEVIDSFNLCSTINSIRVIENTDAPSITLETSKRLDCTNPTTVLVATSSVEGQYQWSTENGNILNGGNTLEAMVNEGGTYKVQVENIENGCSASDTIQVIDNQERPKIDAGNNTAITCYNDTLVQLNGSLQSSETNLLFEWSSDNADFQTIEDSLNITIHQSGTYYLKATNPITACIQIDSVIVSLNTQVPDIALVNNYPAIDCRSPELEIGSTDFSISDTTAYKWTTEEGILIGRTDMPTTIVGAAGTYELEVLNVLNGCANQVVVTIEAKGGLPTVSLGSDQIITCDNPQVQIGTDSSSTGNNFDYQWMKDGEMLSPNQADKIITVQEAGRYQLTIENTDTGCEATATVNIEEQKSIEGIQFPNNTSIDCRGSVSVLSITQADATDELTYNWTTSNGNIINSPLSPEISVDQAGTYQIVVTSTLSGCTLRDSVFIENNRIFPMIDLGEDQLIRCDQPTIELASLLVNEGEEFQYEWKDVEGNIIARTASTTIDKSGNYSLKITNEENGCLVEDEVTVQENTSMPQDALLAISSPACRDSRNASIEVLEIVGGKAPYSIQLNGAPIENQSFDNLLAGVYNLTIQDSLACAWDTTITIEAPAALDVQIISSADQLVTGDMVNLSIGGNTPATTIAMVDWQPAELFTCNDCADQTLALFNDTQIDLAIIDENGCEGFATTFIEVELSEMPNAITPNGDGMNDFLKIPAIEADPDRHPDNEIVIFNRWGDVVYRATPYRNDWNGTNNGETLPEGTYYYVVRLDVSEGAVMKGMVTILK